jgi:hypothetical protein
MQAVYALEYRKTAYQAITPDLEVDGNRFRDQVPNYKKKTGDCGKAFKTSRYILVGLKPVILHSANNI